MTVVFAPTRYDEEAKSACRRGRIRSWTCLKSAEKGDLYLFYFAKPLQCIAALGIVNSEVEEEYNDGWEWTDAEKGWFCEFRPAIWLRSPIAVSEVKANAALSKWWNSRPYRGRPKRLTTGNIAIELCHAVLQANPSVKRLVPLAKRLHTIIQGRTKITCISPLDDDDAPPERVQTTIARIIRDTAKGNQLKHIYPGFPSWTLANEHRWPPAHR